MSLLGPNGVPLGAPAPAKPVPAPSTPIQEDAPAAPTRVTTAFLIMQLPNGQWIAADDVTTPLAPMRKPVPDDLIAGTANVQAQIIARKTADMAAKATVQTQMSLAAQMQEQAMNAQIAQQLGVKK